MASMNLHPCQLRLEAGPCAPSGPAFRGIETIAPGRDAVMPGAGGARDRCAWRSAVSIGGVDRDCGCGDAAETMIEEGSNNIANRDMPYSATHEWRRPQHICKSHSNGSVGGAAMRETPEYVELFRALLSPAMPHGEVGAGAALVAAARETRWRRNQPCDAVVARGAVACVLAGAVRKFALRTSGQRQIVDLIVAGEFLGFVPPDPPFFLEAVSNETRIACFTRDQIERLSARFAAISALRQNCAADSIRRLEHHLLVQSRFTAREKVGAYLAEIASRMKQAPASAITLPITRYDIADHLGIAVETVSRTMSALRRRGSITLTTPRNIEIRDLSMLSDS